MNKRICALIMAVVMMTVMMLSPSHPALGAYSDNVAGVTDARVYYANVARTGPFQLRLNVDAAAYGQIGQYAMDFDNDGQQEYLSIKFSPDGAGHETLTASISETDGRSASVTLLSWTEASSYENRSADVSCVMIGNTMMVCAESYSAGTLATSYSSEFKAVYYNGVAFGNYYSYNNSGSSFSADEVSSAIAGFQNAGFNVTTTKLFSWGQSSFVAEQLNGVNICGVTIRFTGADGELYAFASGQLAYVRPFEYVIQGSIAANVAPTIDVLLNGVALSFDQPPVMEGDRVLVPLRTIFEALGYQVEWYSDTQTAIASNGSRTIIAQINNPQIVHSSGTYLCDVSPKIISGRTLVPVRAISECAGCSVLWNGDTQTVSIYS